MTFTRQSLKALALAEEGIEAARTIRDANWNSVTSGTHGLVLNAGQWNLQTDPDVTDEFTRAVTISETALNERAVNVNVSWNSADDSTQNINLETLLTDWRNIAGPLLSGNWQNPQTLGSIDLGPGNAGTGLAVSNNKVYMSAKAADKKKDDLYVINVANGAAPSILAKLNTGIGANAVAVSGTRAYLANADATAQLNVIDVSGAPTLLSAFRLPGSYSEGLSIAVAGTLAFIGTHGDAGPEFFIVDVSNGSNPVLSGSLEIGSEVNDLAFFNGRVFIATSDNTRELIEIDVSEPSLPAITASLDIPGNGDGKSLFLNTQDFRAYMGRVQENGANTPELVVMDLRHQGTPALIGTMDFTHDVNAVYAADDLGFFGLEDANMEFQVYNVSNLSNMTYFSGLNFPQSLVDFAFENNSVFAAVRSNDALRIITSQ